LLGTVDVLERCRHFPRRLGRRLELERLVVPGHAGSTPPNLILRDSIGHAEYLMTAKVQVQQGLATTFCKLFLGDFGVHVFSLRVRQRNACDEMWFAFYDMHLAR
jgi:hypothetical protein